MIRTLFMFLLLSFLILVQGDKIEFKLDDGALIQIACTDGNPGAICYANGELGHPNHRWANFRILLQVPDCTTWASVTMPTASISHIGLEQDRGWNWGLGSTWSTKTIVPTCLPKMFPNKTIIQASTPNSREGDTVSFNQFLTWKFWFCMLQVGFCILCFEMWILDFRFWILNLAF